MDIKKVEIIKLDDLGRGIGYVNDKIIFIPNALPNELVSVKITYNNKKYLEGEVIKYYNKSHLRTSSFCPYYNLCGGCSLQHISYLDTLQFKKEKVKNILNKFAKLDADIDIVKNDKEINYRNKIELKIEDNIWGYYNNKSHSLVSIDYCLIALSSINEVLKYKNYFDIKNGCIAIRSNSNNEILISINSNDKVDININELKKYINLKGVIVNDKVIYKESYFIEEFDNLKFKVNYNSFFQVNLFMFKKIVDYIKENIIGNNLLDLYCGVGILGQVLSNKFKKVYGIELNEDSIKDANYNMKLNNINNIKYICSNAKDMMKYINDSIDTLIVDPPRSGLLKSMIEDILKLNIKNVIYVSCNPISLSRDLNLLKDKYEIKDIKLFDMFSYTYHVECVCVLKLR